MKYWSTVSVIVAVGVVATLAIGQPSVNSSAEEKSEYAQERNEELAGEVMGKVSKLQETIEEFTRVNEASNSPMTVFPSGLQNKIMADGKALVDSIDKVAKEALKENQRLYGGTESCKKDITGYMEGGYVEFQRVLDDFQSLDPETEDTGEAGMMLAMSFTQQFIDVMDFSGMVSECLLIPPSYG